MSDRHRVTGRELSPKRRRTPVHLDLNALLILRGEFGRVSIVDVVQMDTLATLRDLAVRIRPLCSSSEVRLEVPLTIRPIDVEVDDDMVVRNLHVMKLPSVDVA